MRAAESLRCGARVILAMAVAVALCACFDQEPTPRRAAEPFDSRTRADAPAAGPALVYRGRIVDRAGDGVGGLDLAIEFEDSWYFGYLGGQATGSAIDLRTDADGRFQVRLPVSATNARPVLREEGVLYYPWQAEAVDPRTLHLGVFELPASRQIAGRALRADGKPLADTVVRIGEDTMLARLLPDGFLLHELDDFGWTADRSGHGAPIPDAGCVMVRTDRDGRFSAQGRFSRPIVSFQDEHGVPHAFRCEESADWSDLQLTAHALHPAVREFRTESDRPAAGATCAVTVSGCWGEHEVLRVTSVPGDGKVRFLSEYDGKQETRDWGYVSRRTVAVHAGDSGAWVVRSGFWSEGAEGPMVVPGKRDLAFRVVDQDGEPVDGAQAASIGLWTWEDPFGPLRAGPVAVEEVEDGLFLARGAPGAETAFVIQADGYMPGVVAFAPYEFAAFDPDWAAEQVVELHRSSRPEIELVSGPDGTPMPGASIFVGHATDWSSDEPACELHESPLFGNRGLTDEDGTWRPRAVCARGSWFGAFARGSLVQARWDGTGDRFVLDFGALVEVSGTVRNHEGPRPDLRLRFRSAESFNEMPVVSDADGRFSIMLQPGTYEIGHGVFGRLPVHDASDGRQLDTITVREGEPLTLDLKASGR